MEENTNVQETQQDSEQPTAEQEQTFQQPESEKKKPLMPGQEHEDELDYMGAALFAVAGKAFGWINNLFSSRKVQ